MSNSLINTAMSGLNAAQAALSTVSNNIANVSVAGYNRQTAIIAQSNGTNTAAGYIGNGVSVSSINREYNAFVVNQLMGASTVNSALSPQSPQRDRSITCYRTLLPAWRRLCRNSSPA